MVRELPFPLNALTRRIGLIVTPESVGAVITRGRFAEWCEVAQRDPGVPASVSIIQLLHALPSWAHRWPRPRVYVAIDARASRVRTIRGLPAITNARAIAQILTTTPERFFVGGAQGLVITNVQVVESGVVQVATFDIALLEDIQTACAAVNLCVVLYVPTIVAQQVAHTTIPVEKITGESEEFSSTLLAAYGATRLSPQVPLVAAAVRSASTESSVRARRIILAGIVATVAMLIMLTVPIVTTMQASRSARRRIAALAPKRAKALATQADIDAMTTTLARVDSFEQHRISKTLLLAQLTQALPSAATITAFKSDTSGTTVVVLAPHTADVIDGLEDIDGVSDVEMRGPVTQDTPNGNSAPGRSGPTLPPSSSATTSGHTDPTDGVFERVTVRFRVTNDPPHTRRPLSQEGTQANALIGQ